MGGASRGDFIGETSRQHADPPCSIRHGRPAVVAAPFAWTGRRMASAQGFSGAATGVRGGGGAGALAGVASGDQR